MSEQGIIFIFVLEPNIKVFECIRLDLLRDIGQAETATIGDILDFIPTKVAEPALVAQKHRGLCRRKGEDDSVILERSVLALNCIHDGEILIAIPVGFTALKCRAMVQRILEKNPRVARLLEQSDPLAPRRPSSSKKNRPKIMSGNKRLSNGMSLEAIIEDDGDSRSERDTEGSFPSHPELSSISDKRFNDTSITSLASNSEDDIKSLLSEKLERENMTRKEIEALIHRESARKLLEERVQQNAEARAKVEGKIIEKVEEAAAGGNSNLTAKEKIERLAFEASERESSLASESSFSRHAELAPSDPERAFENTEQRKGLGPTNSFISGMLPRKWQQDQTDYHEQVPSAPVSFHVKYKHLKRRARQARNVARQRIKDLLEENHFHLSLMSAVLIALASVLYHVYDPRPLGMSLYAAFISVFAVLAYVVRRRNRIKRRAARRRPRSLSMTSRRKGSIRGILVGESGSNTSARRLSSSDAKFPGQGTMVTRNS